MGVISDVDAIRKSLKVVYKDGMGTLLGREGSAIKEIDFQKAEGKAYNFSAVAGRGGAVAGNYDRALDLAAETGLQAEFSVEPGAIWSTYVINKVDLAAAKSNLGAYAPILKREFYRATAGLRKTLSSALYGRGYGEFAIAPTAITISDASLEYTVALDPSATQKIDVDTRIVFKTHIGDAEENALASGKVTKLLPGMKGFAFKPDATGTITAGAIICVKNSTIPGSTKPLLPIGLDAWFPIVEGRNESGSVWPNFITQTFCAEDRSASVDRMAGAFYAPASASEKIIDTIQGALLLNRSMGGDADMIVMNMFDRADLAKEIAVQNTYLSSTTSKATRKVNVGVEDFSVSSATNLVDLIVDDIDCPRYKFYVLTKSTLAMLIWMAKNDQNKDDGISTNEPGKPDINDVDEFSFNDGVSKLDIDDYVTISDNATRTYRGPAVTVTLGFVGALAVFDPSANVVGYLPAAYGNEATKVLGWTL